MCFPGPVELPSMQVGGLRTCSAGTCRHVLTLPSSLRRSTKAVSAMDGLDPPFADAVYLRFLEPPGFLKRKEQRFFRL